MTLPEALSKARKRLKLNQAKMAKRAGVTQGAISSWESAEDAKTHARPSPARLPKIAEAYDLPLATVERLWLATARAAA